MSRTFVHVGLHKTGTTTLQNALVQSRDALQRQGVVYPDYPEELRKNGSTGTVSVRVDVGPDGKVKTAVISSSKLPAMNALTAEAVKQWTGGFNPRKMGTDEYQALYEAAF